MTTLVRPMYLKMLIAALLVLFTTACGTVEDPNQPQQPSDTSNNHQPDAGKADSGKADSGKTDTPNTPVNPYEALGLPYLLDELPPGTTAPWPGTISHGAVVKITHVIDGDTIGNPLQEQRNIRLLGMDAPECSKRKAAGGMECDPNDTEYTTEANAQYPNEPYGAQSGQALKDLIALNPEVRIACKMVGSECERDIYNRFLTWVVVDTPDGPVDASHYIIENGLGWTYTSYPTENMAMYCDAEDEAIAEKRGMWINGPVEAMAAVTEETRKWYRYRNTKCRELRR